MSFLKLTARHRQRRLSAHQIIVRELKPSYEDGFVLGAAVAVPVIATTLRGLAFAMGMRADTFSLAAILGTFGGGRHRRVDWAVA